MVAVKNIPQRAVFIVTGFMALAGCILVVKDLFFFDEDVFVTQLNSAFMQQGWQRSVLVKQFFKAEHALFGKNPAGYHITSAVLHLLNGALGVILFRKLLLLFGFEKEARSSLIFIFFILFLFSAIHSEPLCYILAQGILLFTFFAQLSLVYFINHARDGRGGIVSLLFFALSLLCYEISWMLPVIVLCLVLCSSGQNKMQRGRGVKTAVLFFAVLFLWLAVKALFISKSLVADYENVTAGSISLLKVCRNTAVLFARNFIPPSKNTIVFIVAAIVLILLMFFVLVKMYRSNRRLSVFAILLVILIMLAFLPAALFGIDSHDSESERYIYFSSLFALMLLSVFLTFVFKKAAVSKILTSAVCFLYAAILFVTVGNYKAAGKFSSQYLDVLHRNTKGAAVVYTFNQPSQFKGALLLRALTRLPQKQAENVTVLAEYMRYLYNDSAASFITMSVAEPVKPYAQVNVAVKVADSAAVYFPEAVKIISTPSFNNNTVVIAGLRHDTLFVFR